MDQDEILTRRDFGKLITVFMAKIQSKDTKRSYVNSFESFRDFMYSKKLIRGDDNYREALWYLVRSKNTDAQHLAELFQLHEKNAGILASTVNRKIGHLAKIVSYFHGKDIIYWQLTLDRIPTDEDREPQLVGPPIEVVKEALNHTLVMSRSDFHCARNYLIMRLIFECSLRATSLAAIDMEDLELADNYLKYIKKGRKDKTGRADLLPNAMEAMQTYLKEREKFLSRPGMKYRKKKSGPLFLNRAAKRMTRESIINLVLDIGASAGIPGEWSLNRLRHSSVRAALDVAAVRQISLVDVKNWSGKKSMKSLLAYADESRPNIQQITKDLSDML